MKKGVILGSIAGALLLVLTGCGGEQHLICTASMEQDGTTLTEEVDATFKNDVATHITMVIEAEVSDEDQLDEMEEGIESLFTTADFAAVSDDYDIQTNGNTVRGVLNLDLESLTEEEKEEVDFSGSYDDVKSSFESSGFTCR